MTYIVYADSFVDIKRTERNVYILMVLRSFRIVVIRGRCYYLDNKAGANLQPNLFAHVEWLMAETAEKVSAVGSEI